MTFLPLIMEVLLSLLLSLSAVAVLLPVLRPLLVDLCGGALRAAFWLRYSLLLLVAAPLVLTLLLVRAEDFGPEMVRQAVMSSLAGLVIGLMIAGRTILKFIRSQPQAPQVKDDASCATSL